MIAISSDRNARAMELNSDQDRTISIALWRADSFLAPIVSKYAAAPINTSSSNSDFLTRRIIPSMDEAFVRSRFHFPQVRDEIDASSNEIPSRQLEPSMAATTLMQATVSNWDWTNLYDQLPKEEQPSRDELIALNRPENVRNNAKVQNNFYAGNSSIEFNSDNDLQTRNRALQNVQAQTNLAQSPPTIPPEIASELGRSKSNQGLSTGLAIGISKPIWFHENLLIARTVRSSDQIAIQGIELDWPMVRAALTDQVQDLLPDADFQPMTNIDSHEHLLAALPARMVVPTLIDDGFRWSPLMVAVAAGWAVMLIMSGGLVAISLSALQFADKRSSFVNSVTHELRTPLTTFKMYSELLSRGMVDEASKHTYLQTLCSESNRLCHLIDNVLTYARLENGAAFHRKEELRVEQVMSRIVPRLTERAALDSMLLDVQFDEKHFDELISVDLSSLEQILFNLLDNSSKYSSQSLHRTIQLSLSQTQNNWCFRVTDSGPGISRAQRAVLFKPFSKSSEQAAKSKPGVGLGLCLSARLAKQLDGQLRHVPTATGCTMELLLPKG